MAGSFDSRNFLASARLFTQPVSTLPSGRNLRDRNVFEATIKIDILRASGVPLNLQAFCGLIDVVLHPVEQDLNFLLVRRTDLLIPGVGRNLLASSIVVLGISLGDMLGKRTQ